MSSISAPTNFEVNGSAGNDANGGGFDPTIAGGVDYTQGAGTKSIVLDGTTVFFTTAAASATITLTGYTVLAGDVGNVLHTTGGTNVTAGYWTIASVSTGANTWTLGASVTTGATSNGAGRAGGAFASPGAASAVPMQPSNVIFVKGGQTYSMSASNNAPGGRCTISGSICGYNATRSLYNLDANLPVFQSSANSITLFTSQTSGIFSSLVIANGNANTGVTGCADPVNYSNSYFNVKATGIVQAVVANQHAAIESCAAINCTHPIPIASSGNFVTVRNCVVSGGGGIQGGGADSSAIGCVVANSGASGSSGDFSGFGGIYGCVSYHHTGTGAPAFTGFSRLVNCIVHSQAGTGGGITPVTSNPAARIHNCAFYNNLVDIAALGYCQLVGKITLTADPFTNAAGGDFTLNNAAGGGALLRGAGWPATLPPLAPTSALDVGAYQHAAAAAAALGFPVVGAAPSFIRGRVG